jgi:hypothetical protein
MRSSDCGPCSDEGNVGLVEKFLQIVAVAAKASTQIGGERARLAPEVSLAGMPRGSQEGVNTVVVTNGGLDVRS